MCIIICKPEGVDFPSLEILETCEIANPDGAGIAYIENEKVVIKKDFKSAFDLHSFTNGLSTKAPAIIHFRIATSGKVDMGNRHPFPLSPVLSDLRALNITTDMAMAHHGILFDMPKLSKKSDTQLFIIEALCDPLIKNNLNNIAVQNLIELFFQASNSKCAILDGKTNKLFMFGDFISDSGLFFSSTVYKGCYNWKDKYTYWNEIDTCVYCGKDFWNDKKAFISWEQETICDNCLDYLNRDFMCK